LVDITVIDVRKNKKMMVVVVVVVVVEVVGVMKKKKKKKDAFEDKRIVSSKFKSGETGKEGRKQKHEV
jgi:hypothetical protein